MKNCKSIGKIINLKHKLLTFKISIKIFKKNIKLKVHNKF